MNWTKVILAGVVGGVVRNIADFVMHGLIMGSTYTQYPDVFDQEGVNPAWFFLVAITVALATAILFAKTRECWGDGLAGGATFGFWVGLVALFASFYNPLVIDGFPYFLAWCWGGIDLLGFVILGAIFGAIYPRPN